MREIKFRAWFELENKMVNPENLALSYDGEDGVDFAFDKEFPDEEGNIPGTLSFKLMQYTGFEGTYEGDILYGEESDEYGSIYSRWYGLVYWDEERCGFYVKDDLEEIYRLDDFDYDRIAGNIYENPELLEAVE